MHKGVLCAVPCARGVKSVCLCVLCVFTGAADSGWFPYVLPVFYMGILRLHTSLELAIPSSSCPPSSTRQGWSVCVYVYRWMLMIDTAMTETDSCRFYCSPTKGSCHSAVRRDICPTEKRETDLIPPRTSIIDGGNDIIHHPRQHRGRRPTSLRTYIISGDLRHIRHLHPIVQRSLRNSIPLASLVIPSHKF